MQTCAAGYALTYLSTPKQQLVTWMVVGLTAPKFKPLTLPMHGFSLSSCTYILSYCSDYRQGTDWLLNLLTTCIHHLELHFTDDWYSQTSVLSLLQSPLAIPWQRLLPVVVLQRPALKSSCHSCPWRILVNKQLNQLGPRLVAISHQPPSLLLTSWLSTQLNWTELNCKWTLSLSNQLLHITSLNWTADNSDYFRTWLTLLVTFWHEPHRKHRFQCYSPTIPHPLLQEPVYWVIA
jgi:hypothetical protein